MGLQRELTTWCALACAVAACSGKQSGGGDNGGAFAGTSAGAFAGTGAAAGGSSAIVGSGGSSAATGSSGKNATTGGSGGSASGTGGVANSSNAGSSAGGSSGSVANNAGSGGSSASGNGGSGSPSMPIAGDLFAAPDGKDGATGTMADPLSFSAALTKVEAGNTIFVRAGTYSSNAQITIARDNSGSDGKPKQLYAYNDEKPVLDFSSEPYSTGSNPRGLQIDGSYWHVRGLEVKGAADNGIYVSGNNNIIEGCIIHDNKDTGLQLGRYSSSAAMSDWPANNLILNCESYDNDDSPPGTGENADGFAAKLTVGPGNVFRGCVSHNNIDDGWDLYSKTDTGPISPVTIDQCISHHNGKLTNGMSSANGDGNGFKLGGDKIPVAHIVTRSVAYGNIKNGFTWNSNPGAIHVSNTLAFDNAGGNYAFGDNSTMTDAVFTNNVSFWSSSSGAQSDKAVGNDVSNSNCWWNTGKTPQSVNGKGLIVSADDFANSLANPTIARNPDGSLDMSPFALKSGSDLINAGVVPSGTLPFDPSYYHGMPDLGAVESP